MNLKHTPGPWSNDPLQPTIWANDGDLKIATVEDLPWVENAITGRRQSQSGVEQANARLISAAPEMLEALQACADILERLTPLPIAKGSLCEEQDAATSLRLAKRAIQKALS